MTNKRDIKSVSDDALNDPVTLFLALKFDDFDPDALRKEIDAERDRRRFEREKEYGRRVEEEERQREELQQAVFTALFEHFECREGHDLDKPIVCYDVRESRNYETTLKELIREQLALTWGRCPDPKNLNTFLDWIAVELKDAFQVTFPVRNPQTTLRHNLERITVTLRRKR